MRNHKEHGNSDILEMTAEIVSSYVNANEIRAENLSDLIRSIHKSLITLSSDDFEKPTDKPKAAVSLAKSITDDFIICLEDGKKLKMLKRYLRSKYNLSPEEYRCRWNLPADYPMVAPNYAKLHAKKRRSCCCLGATGI